MPRRLLIALVLLLATTSLVGWAGPAEAAARVTIANDEGKAVADPSYATTVTVKGRGFQSIKGGFGGIYVLFGTVKAGWQPSKGGITGQEYFYVPDSETKDNKGFQKFVAFPGSDTEYAANGGLLKADGTWSTTMLIPGATFQATDRNGKATTIDCLKVVCGVITIGAHGVANNRNETFTPVKFASLGGAGQQSKAASPSTTATTPVTPATTPAAAPQAGGAPAPAAVPAGPARLTVDRATAAVGHVLAFTATGFRPGEQVVVTFDDGEAALGPLSAGASGEVAGALQMPAGTGSGTHVLKVVGAASGVSPTVNFAVTAPASLVADTPKDGSDWPSYAFLLVALVVLAAAAVFVWWRRYARRRVRRGAIDAQVEARAGAQDGVNVDEH